MQLLFKGFAFYYNLFSQTPAGWISYEIRGGALESEWPTAQNFAAISFGHDNSHITQLYITT